MTFIPESIPAFDIVEEGWRNQLTPNQTRNNLIDSGHCMDTDSIQSFYDMFEITQGVK